eukprot:6490840-Amphidinium_carterae.3
MIYNYVRQTAADPAVSLYCEHHMQNHTLVLEFLLSSTCLRASVSRWEEVVPKLTIQLDSGSPKAFERLVWACVQSHCRHKLSTADCTQKTPRPCRQLLRVLRPMIGLACTGRLCCPQRRWADLVLCPGTLYLDESLICWGRYQNLGGSHVI